MAIRFGLCCIFKSEPIKFRSTTAKHLMGMDRHEALKKVSDICLHNADSLRKALSFCRHNGIGCFRVSSGIMPCMTHPIAGYRVEELPEHREIVSRYMLCGAYAVKHDIRTSFHPDQFIVLNSPKADVLRSSIKELDCQAEVASWVHADVINVHAGGKYGDKRQALAALSKNFYKLGMDARRLLTLENDDSSFTPEDLIPTCELLGVPLVYDVHHHRVNGDRLTIEEATRLAISTWDREPMFHLSSPVNGWGEEFEERHHEYIDPPDFPGCWRNLDVTVEVEAKAKELAVKNLMEAMSNR